MLPIYLITENSWRIMPSVIRPNENCWINQNLFIFQAFLFRENSPGGLLFYLYLATFKSYIIMTLNNERKLGTYVPSAFLFGQQFRPGGTFSNQVGTSLCGGHNLPSLVGIRLMYLPKISGDISPTVPICSARPTVTLSDRCHLRMAFPNAFLDKQK